MADAAAGPTFELVRTVAAKAVGIAEPLEAVIRLSVGVWAASVSTVVAMASCLVVGKTASAVAKACSTVSAVDGVRRVA